jgi:hypothetical protein
MHSGLRLWPRSCSFMDICQCFVLPTQKSTGDFDGTVQWRMIRILLVDSKTLYFVDSGVQRSIARDAMNAIQDEMNQELKTTHLRVNIVLF